MIGILINNKIKYNYFLLNLFEFVKLIQNNKNIRKSIEKLISTHRNKNDFKIIDIIIEAYNEIEQNKNTYYFFIMNNTNDEIITS